MPTASAASAPVNATWLRRVAGEDLAAQHQEVADQPGRQGDDGAGQERVLHERVGEHVPHGVHGAITSGSGGGRRPVDGDAGRTQPVDRGERPGRRGRRSETARVPAATR